MYYQLDHLFASTQLGVLVVDARGIITTANSCACQLLDQPFSSLTGLPLQSVLPSSQMTRVLQGGHPNTHMVRLGARTFLVEELPCSEQPAPDSALSILREVTELLEASELGPDKPTGPVWPIRVLEAMHDGIMFVDKDLIVRFINHAYTRSRGLAYEQVVGQPLASVRPALTLPKVMADKRPMIGMYRKLEHSEFIMDAFPVFENGEVIGGVTVTKHIHEIVKLATQVHANRQSEWQLKRRVHNLQRARYHFSDIIGHDGGLAEQCRLAARMAEHDLPVLIRGESGTGKELFAHAIHNQSVRSGGPFVPINCAAIPAPLLESELFGYERGSYTNARSEGKIGLVELAHEGTLLLDEIGEMGFELQAKLLRVVQDGCIRRVGGLKEIPVDVRFISATNRNLEQMVADNAFREDLYYRLNVAQLHVPPLRERPEDVVELARVLIRRLNQSMNASTTLSDEALAMLKTYAWPGNVRELENAIQFAFNNTDENQIRACDLPARMGRQVVQRAAALERTPLPELHSTRARAEQESLREALVRFGTSTAGKRRAADHLGISLSTLYTRLKVYGLQRSGQRTAEFPH